MMKEVSDYLRNLGKENMNIDNYRFSEGAMNRRLPDNNQVLF